LEASAGISTSLDDPDELASSRPSAVATDDEELRRDSAAEPAGNLSAEPGRNPSFPCHHSHMCLAKTIR